MTTGFLPAHASKYRDFSQFHAQLRTTLQESRNNRKLLNGNALARFQHFEKGRLLLRWSGCMATAILLKKCACGLMLVFPDAAPGVDRISAAPCSSTGCVCIPAAPADGAAPGKIRPVAS
jgi:hypothetical protein